MTKQIINIGTSANKGNGDPLRTAFTKVNENFTELYTALGLNVDGTLNLGAFEFTGSVMSTTDSTAITIDQATTVTSNLTVGGDILPSLANGGNLGSSTAPWRSLYVSNNTIYLGGIPLSLDANNNLTVNGLPVTGGGSSVTTSATTPTSPSLGDLWYDTNSGRTYVYYDASWVDSSPVDGAGISSSNQLVNGAYTTSLGANGVLTLADGSIINGATLKTIAGNYAGITAGPASPAGKDEDSWMWVDNNGATIATKYSTDAHTWTFNNSGALTFPQGTTIATADGTDAFIIDGAVDKDIQIYTYSGPTPTAHGWTFGADGTLTLPGKIAFPQISGPTLELVEDTNLLIRSNASDGNANNTIRLANYVQGVASYGSDITLLKDRFTIGVNENKLWTFGADGRVTFPDTSTYNNSRLTGAVDSDLELEVKHRITVSAVESVGDAVGGMFTTDITNDDDITVVVAGWQLNAGTELAPEWIPVFEGIESNPGVYNIVIAQIDLPVGFEFVQGSTYTFRNPTPVSKVWTINNQNGTLIAPGNAILSNETAPLGGGDTYRDFSIELPTPDESNEQRWTFSNEGILTFPDATTSTGKGITIPVDQSLTVNLSYTLPDIGVNTFKINPESIKLPTGNGIIFSGDETAANRWDLDSGNNVLRFPNTGDGVYPQILYSVADNVTGMQLLTYAKSIKITAAQTSTWTFDNGGKLTLPADSSILTSETALNIATHSTETYTFNQAYWAALNGNNTRIFTPTFNAQYFSCTVTANQDGTYTAAVTNGGVGFVQDNWFRIPGNELGGTTPANDIQITIATVDGGGGILTTTVTGTAVSKQWQFGTTGSLTLPDNSVIASYKPVTVIAATTTVQTITNNASAAFIQFFETVDTASAFSPGTFTVPYTGYYQVNLSVYFSTTVTLSSGSFLTIDTNLDGNKAVPIFNGAWTGSYIHYSTVIPAAAGDAVRVAIRSASVSGDIDVSSGSRLTIHRVSIS
jgi:hypothetical protein